MVRAWLFALLLLVLPGSAPAQDAFDPAPLVIETASGRAYTFHVELALTPAQQMRGLMYRESMAADAGMLFVFPDEGTRHFWMKNTLIPLDMLFIAGDGRIVNIGANTVPLSEAGVSSTGPALAVLEINGGLSAMLGIHPGDLVKHPALGS